MGMLICFDLAFPEAARVLALAGAEVILAPSAVPTDFKTYSERRVIARALDNQCFIVYCNLGGEGFGGNSLVVDPRGEVLARCGPDQQLAFCTIDLDTITDWQGEERIFSERRPELYGPVVQDVD
jgi:predicted amidohydrolase